MPRFYPVAVEFEGRRYTGDWMLVQGGDLCVRSRWGNKPGPVGKEKPEVSAKRVLEQIVRDWHRKRERDARQIERETLRVARTGRARNPKAR